MTYPDQIPPEETIIESPFINRRRRWITFVVLLCIAAACYSGWWFWLAGAVRDQVTEWVAEQRRHGRDVQISSLEFSGYPGLINIRASDIQISDSDARWQITVPAVSASLSPWKIDALEGVFDGALEMRRTVRDARQTYTLQAQSNHWTADTDQGGRLRVDLEGADLQRVDTADVLKIENLKAVFIRGSIPVYGTIKLHAGNVTLPERARSPFGKTVKSLETWLEFVSAIPPENLGAKALSRWAGDGGALEVRSLNAIHGTLGINGDGTLSLDNDLQPIGAFRARISGFDAALDQLMAAGLVRSNEGKIAKMVLGAVAKVPPGGGAKQIDVPVSVQDRKLFVGPLQLMYLPTIHW